MMEIKITGVESILDALAKFPKELASAARNAENATATFARAEGFELAAQEFNIEKRRLKKDSRGRDTSWIKRSSITDPGAVVTFKGGDNPKSGDRPGLQHYSIDPSQTNKKIKGWAPTVKIRRGGQSEKVERGFYGVGKLKGRGIFQRLEVGRKIKRRNVLGLKQMLIQEKQLSELVKGGENILNKELEKALDNVRG